MLRTKVLPVTVSALLCCIGAASPAVSDASDTPVTVTSPAADSVHPVDSSLFVGWRNTTGQEVDIWLVQGGGASGGQRMFKLASKASSKPSAELVAAVPPVPDGADYTIEVTTRDTGARAYSAPFAVGPTPGGGPTPDGTGTADEGAATAGNAAPEEGLAPGEAPEQGMTPLAGPMPEKGPATVLGPLFATVSWMTSRPGPEWALPQVQDGQIPL
ncbi:Ser-Thr-rich GPI-anchored membrane family protein [Streptomyces sp. NPDC058067]|uniref:Ser-Thr-rich GPI-anchored membrane family protein n=1 Tax=Streptomyces sp. NPDC058067 TaxID=3346324 RepID=UPI0036ED3BBA